MVKMHVQNCIGEPTLMTYIFTLHSEEHSGTRRQNAIIKHNLNRRDNLHYNCCFGSCGLQIKQGKISANTLTYRQLFQELLPHYGLSKNCPCSCLCLGCPFYSFKTVSLKTRKVFIASKK